VRAPFVHASCFLGDFRASSPKIGRFFRPRFYRVHSTCWTPACAFESAEQTSSLQVVLESSNNQDHADGAAECRGKVASREAVGSDTERVYVDTVAAVNIAAR
jgi:hypothetical protein